MSAAFTLIELICVMALMLVVMAIVSPSLSGFFRGRNVDSEAHRFLALTVHGQTRAVSEGTPMRVWVDPDERRYGLLAEASSTYEDPKALVYEIDKDVQVQVEVAQVRNSMQSRQQQAAMQAGNQFGRNTSFIRLLPDGSIDELSPVGVGFSSLPRQGERERDERNRNVLWVGQSRNRLNYEIQTNHLYFARQ